jgi:hypothetical protein
METGKERIQSQSLSKNFDNFPNLGFFRLVANDTILAVGYMDDQFELWNLKSAKLIIRGRVPARNGNYLDFSKDGTRFSVLEDWGKRSYWDAIRLKRIVMKNDAEGHSFLELYDLIKQSQLLAPRCLFNIEREYLGLPAEQPEWCSRLKKVKH